MARRPRNLRNLVEVGLLRLFFLTLGLVPRRIRLALGRRLGLALYTLSGRLRRMALANLERALGSERSETERIRMREAAAVVAVDDDRGAFDAARELNTGLAHAMFE